MKRRYPAMAASIAAAMVTGWIALSPGDDPTVSASPAPVGSADIGELLSKVTVVDAIPQVPGYERGCGIDQKTKFREGCVFGPAWNDPLDHTGCDTRNRLLAATLTDITFKPNTHNCKVTAGFLHTDPYTGQRVELDQIEADHIYALARAWRAGAHTWTPLQRQIFANDLTELTATSRAANRAKSDAGLDEWLPTYQPCSYITRYLSVAAKYHLPITTSEHTTATTTCPATP